MGVFASTDDPVSTGHEQVVFCQDKQSGLKAIIGIYSTALGPGARRHPLLPVRERGRRPRRRAGPVPRDGVQERARRAGPRRRQGRHLGRPGAGSRARRCCARTAASSSRWAAATTPPATSAPTCRTWTSSPGRPATSPAAAWSTAAPATRRSSPPGASSRACGPRPSTSGARPTPAPAAGSASPGWARSASTSPGTCSTTAPRWSPPTSTRRRWRGPRSNHPQVDLVADASALVAADIDVYAPCALGGALDDDTVPVLRAKVVAGAANNQLAHPGIEKLLADRGILYAPDYVVNAGGVIQVADEIEGFNFDRAKLRATRIYDTTRRDPAPGRRRGRAAGGGRGPAGRAADGRGRPAARDPPALSVLGGGSTDPPPASAAARW